MTQNKRRGIVFVPLFFFFPLVVAANDYTGQSGYQNVSSGPYQNVSSGPFRNVTSGFFQNVISGFFQNVTSGPFRNVTSGFFQNVISGPFRNVSSWIQKFLAPPSPSNLPQPLGQWQQEPTKKPTPTKKAEGTPQVGPFKYKSNAQTEKAAGFAVPAFTFSAPGSWLNRTSANELAAFGSPEEDEEQVDEKQMFSVQAIIRIRATDAYSSLDDFVSQVKASSSQLKEYQLISSLPRKINGLDGHSLETKYQSTKDGRIKHELDYLIFKDGVSFLISGIALDSAWGQRGGEIQSALNSFKFN